MKRPKRVKLDIVEFYDELMSHAKDDATLAAWSLDFAKTLLEWKPFEGNALAVKMMAEHDKKPEARTNHDMANVAIETADFFLDKYLAFWVPSAKKPDAARRTREADDALRMLTIDRRTPEEINEVLDALDAEKPGHNGFLWRTNILSIGKLRKVWNEGKLERVLSDYRKKKK